MKRILALAATLMAAVLLSGCINLTMDLTFNPDGSGKVMMDIGMSDTFLAMQASQGNDFSVESMSDELADTENTRNIQLSEYVGEDGYQHSVFEADVVNMHAFMTEMQQSNDDTVQWKYEALGNGNVLFRMVWKANGGATGMDVLGMGMFSEVVKGQYFTIRLHTPNMAKTNGEWNARTKTAEWKIPLEDILTTGAEISHEFTPGGGLPWLLIGAIAVLLVVALVVLVVLVVVLRRNSAPPA